jgi:hypothetical protein
MHKGQYTPTTNKYLMNAYYDKQVQFKELHIKTVYPSDLFDDYHDYVDHDDNNSGNKNDDNVIKFHNDALPIALTSLYAEPHNC